MKSRIDQLLEEQVWQAHEVIVKYMRNDTCKQSIVTSFRKEQINQNSSRVLQERHVATNGELQKFKID